MLVKPVGVHWVDRKRPKLKWKLNMAEYLNRGEFKLNLFNENRRCGWTKDFSQSALESRVWRFSADSPRFLSDCFILLEDHITVRKSPISWRSAAKNIRATRAILLHSTNLNLIVAAHKNLQATWHRAGQNVMATIQAVNSGVTVLYWIVTVLHTNHRGRPIRFLQRLC